MVDLKGPTYKKSGAIVSSLLLCTRHHKTMEHSSLLYPHRSILSFIQKGGSAAPGKSSPATLFLFRYQTRKPTPLKVKSRNVRFKGIFCYFRPITAFAHGCIFSSSNERSWNVLAESAKKNRFNSIQTQNTFENIFEKGKSRSVHRISRKPRNGAGKFLSLLH